MRQSVLFEQQIARIQTLLENEGSIVTWNDAIIGDADPETIRHVDITIRRSDSVIHIECRLRKKPQDVEWIEQLIGRRKTLKADTMIAVSASGFTKGAKNTASANGIFLRDILTLSDEEVLSWGKNVIAFLGYFDYQDIHLITVFDPESKNKVNNDELVGLFKEKDIFASILQGNKNTFNKQEWLEDTYRYVVLEYIPKSIQLHFEKILMLYFVAKVKYFRKTISVHSIQVFGEPGELPKDRDIHIQKMELRGLEIGRHQNEV